MNRTVLGILAGVALSALVVTTYVVSQSTSSEQSQLLDKRGKKKKKKKKKSRAAKRRRAKAKAKAGLGRAPGRRAAGQHVQERNGALTASADPAKHPNVVLVLIDTLRVHYLSLFDEQVTHAPFLKRLAQQGAWFPRAFSTSSWTAPSTASVFTSRHPWSHGLVLGMQAQTGRKASKTAELGITTLSPQWPTLPERFANAGYSTAGVASNINIGNEFGFSRGFQRFRLDRQAGVDNLAGHLANWKPELDQAEPSFVYLHLNDVHGPHDTHEAYYTAPGPGAKPHDAKRAKYLSEIGFLDAELEKLVDKFVDDDTVLMVVSDHGEEFRDHGGMGHGAHLHDELNRILLIVRAPGRGVKVQTVDVNASLVDVMPTLLELAGLPVDAGFEGTSLAPLLTGAAKAQAIRKKLQERSVLAHRKSPKTDIFAAVSGTWKYIEHGKKPPQLYDHTNDAVEKKNVAQQHSEVVARLSQAVSGARESLASVAAPRKTIELDEETQRELEALGYVE